MKRIKNKPKISYDTIKKNKTLDEFRKKDDESNKILVDK